MSDGMHRPPPYSGKTGFNLEHYAAMNDADDADEVTRLRERVAECDAELVVLGKKWGEKNERLRTDLKEALEENARLLKESHEDDHLYAEIMGLCLELEEAREKIKELEGRWEKAKAEIVMQWSIEDNKKRRGGLDLALMIMNEMDEDIKTDKNGYTTWGDNSICGGCKKEGGLTMKHNSQDTTLCVECLESRGLPCPPENPGWPVLGRRW